jgi:hypothetical protein
MPQGVASPGVGAVQCDAEAGGSNADEREGQNVRLLGWRMEGAVYTNWGALSLSYFAVLADNGVDRRARRVYSYFVGVWWEVRG